MYIFIRETYMDNSTKQKLWKTADQLRSNMDAAEYKHVVLGLIFLKYISDSFSSIFLQMQEDEYYKENPQYIKVVLEPKKDVNVDLEQAAGEFQNELLNQNLRAAIEEKTKSIRELVLARALFSSYLDESNEELEKINGDYSIESIATI